MAGDHDCAETSGTSRCRRRRILHSPATRCTIPNTGWRSGALIRRIGTGIVAFFEATDTLLFNIGGYLMALSVIPMLGFLASLRGALRRAEGEAGWLTLVATGAGLLFLALLVGGGFWHHAVFRIDGLDPQIARLLFDLGNFNFATMWVTLGTLVLTVGLASIWFGAFPKWLGWMGLVVGIASSSPGYSGPPHGLSLRICSSGCGWWRSAW